MQRALPAKCRSVRIRTRIEQRGDEARSAVGDGGPQGCFAARATAGAVHIGPAVEEQRNHLVLIAFDRTHEWRGRGGVGDAGAFGLFPGPVLVRADEARCGIEQRFHATDVASPDGEEELHRARERVGSRTS